MGHHFISSATSGKQAAKSLYPNFHCLGQNLSRYSPEPKTREVPNFCPASVFPPPVVIHLESFPSERSQKCPCHMCWVLYPTVSGWRWRWVPRRRCVCGPGNCARTPGPWPRLLLYSAGWCDAAGCLQPLWPRSAPRWTTAGRRSPAACCAASLHRLIVKGKIFFKLFDLDWPFKFQFKHHWLIFACVRPSLTVCCLICEQFCQFLVLLLLRQQFDGKVGPRHHCSVLHLLISPNLPLRLKYLHNSAKFRHTKQGLEKRSKWFPKLKIKKVKGTIFTRSYP